MAIVDGHLHRSLNYCSLGGQDDAVHMSADVVVHAQGWQSQVVQCFWEDETRSQPSRLESVGSARVTAQESSDPSSLFERCNVGAPRSDDRDCVWWSAA